jgi:hypothetical protein
MFDVYTKLFDYLDARNVVIRQQLGTGADQFAVLLRKQPKARGPALGRQFETYLKELIRYGLKNSATETYFLEFLKGAGILRTSPRGGTRIVLRPRPSTVKLSAKDITDIKKALATAEDMASKLQAPPQKPLPRSPGLLDQIIGEDPRSASVTHGSGGGGGVGGDIPGSGDPGGGVPPGGVGPIPGPRKRPRILAEVAPPRPAPKRGAPARFVAADVPPPPGAPPTATASGKPSRDIKVTGHKPDGSAVSQFSAGEEYRLRFSVGTPVAQNLAEGNTAVQDVPAGGLQTHWVVTSTDVEFVNAPQAANIQKTGETWLAEFDLLIPEEGESDTRTLAIKAGAGPAKLLVTIYAVSGNTSEVYREVSVRLDGAPSLSKDETFKAPLHVHLKTTHEWTTPAEHIQVSIVSGLAIVTTQKYRLEKHDLIEAFTASDNSLGTAIKNVRDSLEQLRETHSDYLDDLNATELAKSLARGNWKPNSAFKGGSWSPLPDEADPPHKAAFEQVQSSKEWRDLASDGYALYNRCFPKGKNLRTLLEELAPGSRVDFHWTEQSGPGFVSHVPWALMYMQEVGVSGPPPDPEKFLGLHFRIGTRSWDVGNGSVAVGGLDTTSAMDLLYWGNQAGDDVAEEALWQANEYKMWKWSKLLPDPALPDPKEQLKRALEQPSPAPVGVLYFYCHCSVGDGAQPVLRFGNTSQPPDTLSRTDISQRSLPDGPLVFANACTTSQADPHMTSELEQRFFERGVRAFIGTETKVPTRLASKFAWLYFQFLYRIADLDFKPMSAGEALTQARIFLWTQYKNVGGLFYSLTNQYDLYLASNEEVLALGHTSGKPEEL